MYFYNLIFIFIQFFLFNFVFTYRVDPNLSIAWGPGLRPVEITLPARYFFLQLVDTTGKNVTDIPKGTLEVYIGHPSENGRCRIWKEVLNRRDGSFIIRYKVYEICFGLTIDARYNNYPIKNFPLTFSGTILPESCNCPQTFDNWRRHLRCEKSYDQIENDLQKWSNVSFSWITNEALKRFTSRGSTSLCFYIVKDNQVHRSCHGQYIGFNMFIDAILLSLLRKVLLPDFFFIANLGDWPLQKITSKHPLPIFSWCGSNDTLDIVLPTYDVTESTLEAMGRVQLDMLSLQGNTGPTWDDKIPKLFWRGRDSSRERLKLIKIGRKYPEKFDVALTNFFFFREEEKEYGPKQPHVSFFEFFNNKYQMNIDGTVASYRLPYLMAGNSLVLKQESPYYEHWYSQLKPNQHYLPIQRDLSDLVSQLNWAMKFDKRARKIARAGQTFAQDHLMPEHIFCYHGTLFYVIVSIIFLVDSMLICFVKFINKFLSAGDVKY